LSSRCWLPAPKISQPQVPSRICQGHPRDWRGGSGHRHVLSVKGFRRPPDPAEEEGAPIANFGWAQGSLCDHCRTLAFLRLAQLASCCESFVIPHIVSGQTLRPSPGSAQLPLDQFITHGLFVCMHMAPDGLFKTLADPRGNLRAAVPRRRTDRAGADRLFGRLAVYGIQAPCRNSRAWRATGARAARPTTARSRKAWRP
jgi:hypothetical protein